MPTAVDESIKVQGRVPVEVHKRASEIARELKVTVGSLVGRGLELAVAEAERNPKKIQRILPQDGRV